jgi:hypothetical protein
MQILAVTQVPHKRRKVGIFSGDQGEPGDSSVRGSMWVLSGESEGVIGMMQGFAQPR